ncbi:MAG TPA: hypothetical protein VMT30_04420 [Candidatus Saccharimonadia bacterium]|nr:hypothetical protein [Candidatus Saccharimonadia bacterium]
MTPVRPRFQINAAPEILNEAKAIAYSRGLSLTEFVLQALAKDGNDKLKKLVEKDLANRTRPGNPSKPKF